MTQTYLCTTQSAEITSQIVIEQIFISKGYYAKREDIKLGKA